MLYADDRCERSTKRCHKPVKSDRCNKGFDIYWTKGSCCRSAHVRGSSTMHAETVDRLISYEGKRGGRCTDWCDKPVFMDRRTADSHDI